MTAPRFKSVDEYLAAQEPTKAKTLRAILDTVQTQFPELEAKIAWNVPTLHRGGKYVVGVAAFKQHLTFSPWSPQVIKDFKAKLADYVVFKNCFQVPVDWTPDRALLKALVRARLAELE